LKQLYIRLICSICLLLCMATIASAQHAQPYLSLTGGLQLADEMTLSDQTGDYTLDFEDGFFTGGAFGFYLGDAFPQLGKGRIELEVGFRYNELKEAHFATGTDPAYGEMTTISVMLNTLAEYRNYSPYYIPYVGVGVGFAHVAMIDTRVGLSPMIDDESLQIAYQALAGVSIPLREKLALDCGYRFFSTLDPEFTDAQNRKVNAEYGSHAIELALRLSF